MLKSRLDECNTLLNSALNILRADIVADLNVVRSEKGIRRVGENEVGLSVWLLPPWYWRKISEPHPHWELLTDFTASLRWIAWPRLKRAAELRIPGLSRSGVRWAVKKGLLGASIHDEGPDFKVLIHTKRWDCAIPGDPTKREFEQMHPNSTLGHTRADIRRLSVRHGTAVGFRLKREPDAKAFGCLTAHTQRDLVLDQAEVEVVGARIVAATGGVADMILRKIVYVLR